MMDNIIMHQMYFKENFNKLLFAALQLNRGGGMVSV